MKPIIGMLAMALVGCSSRSLTTPDGRSVYRSDRLGTREQVKEIVYQTPDGALFRLRGYSSDQVEALAAVAEAAARGARGSVDPGSLVRTGAPAVGSQP